MGIWLELGVFIVVLLWGFWQLRDVKKAQARTREEKARRAARDTADAAERDPP
jgi:hypothetical protein